MLKVQNKSTKRIRIVLIIAFMAQILLTGTAYFLRFVYDGKLYQYTVLDMVYMIFKHDASADLFSGVGIPVMMFSLFLILPVVALAFQIFDFYYNIKNVVGILVSIAGVYMILNFVGLANLGTASLLALLLYIFTAFMSVMGMMARYVKTADNNNSDNKK